MIHANIRLRAYFATLAALSAAAHLEHGQSVRRERSLTVVLPVLQERNISGKHLQYVYTKKPVTLTIDDAAWTTGRPAATKPWPASFAAKAQVFLVEPSVRRTSAPHNAILAQLTKRIAAPASNPNAPTPNYWAVLRLGAGKNLAARPTHGPWERIPSSAPSISGGVSAATAATAATTTTTTNTSVERLRTDMNATGTPARSSLDEARANASDADWSATVSNEKVVAQLALDLQASTDKLTNDVKSMLLHLGLSAADAAAPHWRGDSNELWPEKANSDLDAGAYSPYQQVATASLDGPATRDHKRQSLRTFQPHPATNETKCAEGALVRVARSIREPTANIRRGFNQAEDAAAAAKVASMRGGPRWSNRSSSSGGPPAAAFVSASHKPTTVTTTTTTTNSGQGRRRINEPSRRRAIADGRRGSANRVVSRAAQSDGAGAGTGTGTASADQLSGSFGGLPIVQRQTSTAAKQETNGLYFWVDWNTFFNVTGKPRVRVGYSSQAGDPTNFVHIHHWSSL